MATNDEVDLIIDAWARERPDIDFAPLDVFSRLRRLSRRLGRRPLLVGSVALSALGLAVTVVPLPLSALALVVVAVGFGLGAGQPLTMSWLAESTPPGLRGRAMSLRLTGNRLGQVLVPSVAGLLAAGTGAGGALVLTATALGAAGVTALRIDPGPRVPGA